MSTVDKTGKKHVVGHHFNDAHHEFDSAKFGVWLFLATEILMFGGLFVAYALYSGKYPEIFERGAQELSWMYGAVNTVVLLLSSFTIAVSIHFLQKNNIKAAIINLSITIGCGFIFMAIKAVEYSSKISHGLLPGKYFQPHDLTNPVENLAMYFSFYFTMTGIHGVHVLIGMGLIAWVLIKTIKGHFNSEYYTPVEGVALFWHLVDLVWIYLFPLLYLV